MCEPEDRGDNPQSTTKKRKKKKKGEKMPDPSKWLLHKSRVVFLFGRVDEKMANEAISQMLYLEMKDKKKPIVVLINSGGGQVVSGLAIYDMMRNTQCPVYTICVGRCSSMAAVILAGGDKGHRGAFPHCTSLARRVRLRSSSTISHRVDTT